MANKDELSSIAIVITNPEEINYLDETLKFVYSKLPSCELVVLSNGIPAESHQALIEIINRFEDATLHILNNRVNDEFGYLIAMDQCIGARILLIKLGEVDRSSIGSIVDMAVGVDIVVAHVDRKESSTLSYRLNRKIFMRLYTLLTGVSLDNNLALTRMISRDAARYILSMRDAEMSFKFAAFGLGYSVKTLSVKTGDEINPIRKSVKGSFSKAYHRLNKASSMPIRGMVGLSLAAALVNLIYACYVIISYFVREQTAPGWTTQSLQISGMFFIFSIVLAIMGEVLISIDRSINSRLNYTIQREIRSNKSSIQHLRNVNVIKDDAN